MTRSCAFSVYKPLKSALQTRGEIVCRMIRLLHVAAHLRAMKPMIALSVSFARETVKTRGGL